MTARPGLTAGATLLLHDSDCTSAPGSWRATLAGLPLIAAHCRAHALALGPLRDHAVPPVSCGARSSRPRLDLKST